jgi:tetratricopeptide (TPR) repeat protein
VLALALLVFGVLKRLPIHTTVPPVPASPALADLDPQVRAHLAGLVRTIEISPTDPPARASLGLAYAANGLWLEARQCFQDAVALGDRTPWPRVYAAVALQEIGDLGAASDELRGIVDAFPDCAPAWHRFGRACLALGDADGADAAFETVTRLAPDAWQGWAGLGESRLRSGRIQDAARALERAVALDPMARSARYLLGQAYRAMGRATDAQRELAAGISQSVGPMPDGWSQAALGHMKLLPDQFEQADALVAEGRADAAVALLQETLRFHPTNTAVIVRLANVLREAQQGELAWRLLTAALASQPEDLRLLTSAAQTAAQLGNAEEALDLAGKAIALAPASADAHVAQANALLARGADSEAALALERAIEWAPQNVDLMVQLGDLQWRNLGQSEAALESYQRALGLDPIHPVALERLASLRITRREPMDALALIARLRDLRIDPEVLHALEHQLRKHPPDP